jgi:2-iminobutanoate/2-iminopropanoate deaminase
VGVGTVEAEVGQVFDNLELIMRGLGSGLDQVAKIKATFVDWRGLSGVGDALKRTYGRTRPAFAAVAAPLPPGASTLQIGIIAGCGISPIRFETRTARESSSMQVCNRLGDLVLSDGTTAEAGLDTADLRLQTNWILEALSEGLNAVGARLGDVAKIHGTTGSWHNFLLYNEIYNKYFTEPYAARATVMGSLPSPDAMIGVEAFALLGDDRQFVESERPGVGHFALGCRTDTLYSPNLHPAFGPHSHGVRVGDLIFTAGEVACDGAGRLVKPGDIRAQTRQTLENVQTVVETLGGTMGDVVHTDVTLHDPRHVGAFDEVYSTFFTAPYPARNLVGGGLGQPNLLVEIEAIAVRGAANDAVAAIGAG